jgi:hypothetical protein
MRDDDFRAADTDAMTRLARELDDAADAVARVARACAAEGYPPARLATVESALRERAATVRTRACGLDYAAVARILRGPGRHENAFAQWGHLVLGLGGYVPLAGAVPDTVNAAWYAAEGRPGDAALAAVAAVPWFGDVGEVVRFATVADSAFQAGESVG